MIYWRAKAPGDVEGYTFDFTSFLVGGETISAHTVTAAGVTKNSDSIAGSVVTAEISGGTLGTPGVVTASVTTSAANTYSQTGIVPIGEEPVTLDMAKAQCRAEGTTADDNYLLLLIQSAREHVEKYTGSRLVSANVQMTFASFDDAQWLTQAPVQSITQVQYIDENGVLQTLDPTIYEFVNVSSDILRPRIRAAFNQQFPATRVAEDAVKVSATVGYTVVPMPMIRAMLLMIGQWYDNRQEFLMERGTFAQLPNAVADLLANYRR